jgi:hypothetical protein
MKKPILGVVLLCLLLSLSSAYGTGLRKHPASAHPRTYSRAAHHLAAGPARTTAAGITRPRTADYYGATNAHHRNGHYGNWNTRSRYGVHKPR